MDTVKLSSIKPNADNPRILRDEQYKRLLASIIKHPEFLAKRGIVHADGVILGGNMRYRVIREALKDETFRDAVGVKSASEIPASWVQDASDWDESARQAFILIDNSPDGISGDWDYDILANMVDEELLEECGLELDLPPEAETKEPQQEGFYKIEIDCKTEIVLEKLLQEMQERGLECRALIY